MNLIIRLILRLWARTGIASGYLYRYLDNNKKLYSIAPLWRRIVGGSYIFCDLGDHIQKQVYYFGAYEPIEAYLFYSLIKPHMNIIDAGTNIGFYSILCASKLKEGRVFSFEPVPRNFKKFTDNLERSPHKGKIIPLNLGLWEKSETLNFCLPVGMEDNPGSFSAGEYSEAEGQVDCQVVNFDQYSKGNNITKIDMLKMDIEGAELGALNGMREMIERDKPIILLEVNKISCNSFDYSPDELWDFLKQFGYHAYIIEAEVSKTREISNFSGLTQSNIILSCDSLEDSFIKGWSYKGIKRFFAKG